MAEKFTEGVGRRIVDALKQQSNEELNIADETANASNFEQNSYSDDFDNQSFDEEFNQNEEFVQPVHVNTPSVNFETSTLRKDNFASDLEDFEVPANIAVLKQLINQLPASVSRQTGAVIIKQTMEALGISMKNVLQEAQQVQEGLTNSVRECQNSIIEYKNQISALEKQSQKLQRQYSALNDIISLFVQTNI